MKKRRKLVQIIANILCRLLFIIISIVYKPFIVLIRTYKKLWQLSHAHLVKASKENLAHISWLVPYNRQKYPVYANLHTPN